MTTVPDTNKPEIPGYDFGSPSSHPSPVSREELLQLEETLGWTQEDGRLLLRHAELFNAKAVQLVDSWRAVIAAQPHLSHSFVGQDGKPDEEYKARVKARFVQWVIDVATRPHDVEWLNYQEEIGLRHTPAKKNRTDGTHSPPVVPLRYLFAFVAVVADAREIFQSAIADEKELRDLERAWAKAVHLHVALWSRPYTRDGLW
jgi:hypothetical protein